MKALIIGFICIMVLTVGVSAEVGPDTGEDKNIIRLNNHYVIPGWSYIGKLYTKQICIGTIDDYECMTNLGDLRTTTSGGGGMSKNSLGRYLTGITGFYQQYKTYDEYAVTKYATKGDIEKLHERIDWLEAKAMTDNPKEQQLIAMKKKAERTGLTQYHGSKTCTIDYCY